MKKIISILLSLTILAACFSLPGINAFAQTMKNVKEYKVGQSFNITLHSEIIDWSKAYRAKFVPKESGYYEFVTSRVELRSDETWYSALVVDSNDDVVSFVETVSEETYCIDLAAYLTAGKTYYYAVNMNDSGVNSDESYDTTINVTLQKHKHNYVSADKTDISLFIDSEKYEALKNEDGTYKKICTMQGCYDSGVDYYNSLVGINLEKTRYTYDGTPKEPALTFFDLRGKTIPQPETITYKYYDNTDVGVAAVIIKEKEGDYTYSRRKPFLILPKGTSISSVAAQYKGFTVKWKKQTTQTTGYHIQYSTSPKFEKYKSIILDNNKATSKTITGLVANKKYYVRIRTYKTVNGSNCCSEWSKVKTVTTSSHPTTVTLSKTSYTYDGKVKKPTVTVKNNGKTVNPKYYTVTYSKNRKSVDTYTVTVKFKKPYSGTVKKAFTIKPKSTSISGVTAKSKGFTVKWKKQKTQTTGYQIQYSTSSKFADAQTVTVSKNTSTSKTVSKLKGDKEYYVRIRTYKAVNGKIIYSAWSKAKAVTTKR